MRWLPRPGGFLLPEAFASGSSGPASGPSAHQKPAGVPALGETRREKGSAHTDPFQSSPRPSRSTLHSSPVLRARGLPVQPRASGFVATSRAPGTVRWPRAWLTRPTVPPGVSACSPEPASASPRHAASQPGSGGVLGRFPSQRAPRPLPFLPPALPCSGSPHPGGERRKALPFQPRK